MAHAKQTEMSQKLAQKLNSLKLYRTAYEVIIIMPSGEKFLFGYIAAKSYARLYRAAQKSYDALVASFGFDSFHVLKPHNKAEVENGIPLIAYSGRTQRDAYCNGELKYYKDCVLTLHLRERK